MVYRAIEAAMDALEKAARDDGFNDTGPVPIMAARQQILAAVSPEGWVITRKEPTDQQLEAGRRAMSTTRETASYEALRDIYKAMVGV